MADTHDYEHALMPAGTIDEELAEIERAKTRQALQTKYAVRPGTAATIQAAEVGTPEPARKVGAIGSVLSILIGVVVYYGYDVPPDLEKQLLTLLGAFAVLWPALTESLRGKVTPVAKAQALIDAAFQMDPNDPRTVKPSIT